MSRDEQLQNHNLVTDGGNYYCNVWNGAQDVNIQHFFTYFQYNYYALHFLLFKLLQLEEHLILIISTSSTVHN